MNKINPSSYEVSVSTIISPPSGNQSGIWAGLSSTKASAKISFTLSDSLDDLKNRAIAALALNRDCKYSLTLEGREVVKVAALAEKISLNTEMVLVKQSSVIGNRRAQEVSPTDWCC